MITTFKEHITIFSAKKIMETSLSENLNLNITKDSIPKNIDKDKSYLLYIHVPFCDTFCPYCSFHKFKYDEQTSINYFKNLRKEMMIVKEKGFKFNSLYIGGGTPFTNEKELKLTIELAKKIFDINEVSCETDPNHISPSTLIRFDGLIDRLSIGVQTFNDEILKKFSRYKKFGSSEILQEKLSKIQGILPITNIDLMFNIPMQTKEMLLNDLSIVKKLNIDQITMYPLMSSNMTKKNMLKVFSQQKNSNEYEYYQLIQKEFKTFKQNNAWTFSKNDIVMCDEYIGNNAEYIGIGSGAFSFLENKSISQMIRESLSEYLDKSKGFPICKMSSFFTPTFTSETITLTKGDRVIFYTDGLTDNVKNSTISQEQLENIMYRYRSLSLKSLNISTNLN